jgi:ferredoxin
LVESGKSRVMVITYFSATSFESIRLTETENGLQEGNSGFKFIRKDPLAILGVAILIFGIILTIYGLIPLTRPNYSQIGSGPLSVTDPSGNFIFDPNQYFQSHYNGTGSVDMAQCTPSTNGFYCYAFQLIGTKIVYSIPAREYGFGLMIVGVLGIYAGNRLAPFKPKPKHERPITIRIEEDLCVANGVCVSLTPNVFQLKKQETPSIFAPLAYIVDPYGADNDSIIQAAEMCPTGAIIIEDAETGERIHPPYPDN